MGKSSASDVLQHFNQSCSKLKKEKVMQVFSDGLDMNFKFLDLVNENRGDDELPGLISIGTCGLHTINDLHGMLIMRKLQIPQFILFNSFNTDGWKMKT